jgi:hypothetical protein
MSHTSLRGHHAAVPALVLQCRQRCIDVLRFAQLGPEACLVHPSRIGCGGDRGVGLAVGQFEDRGRQPVADDLDLRQPRLDRIDIAGGEAVAPLAVATRSTVSMIF